MFAATKNTFPEVQHDVCFRGDVSDRVREHPDGGRGVQEVPQTASLGDVQKETCLGRPQQDDRQIKLLIFGTSGVCPDAKADWFFVVLKVLIQPRK